MIITYSLYEWYLKRALRCFSGSLFEQLIRKEKKQPLKYHHAQILDT